MTAGWTSSSPPVFFRRPENEPTDLCVPPRLASWNAADHPDQIELAKALGHAADTLAPTLTGTTGPLALRLDVGLPATVGLLTEHDLDNYVYPLAAHLGRAGTPFVSVWCTKQHADTSFIRAELAIPTGSLPTDHTATVRTTASGSSTVYKKQIHDQLADAVQLPEGPLTLQLAYVVGRRRNWLNLWKPTIDALDRLLGRTRPGRDWHPLDGRITELGLHCRMDDSTGNDFLIAIAASSSTATQERTAM